MKKRISILAIAFLLISIIFVASASAYTQGSKYIIVKTLEGVSRTYCVEFSDTVDALKLKIQDKDGFLTVTQRLVYNGTELEDGRTLSDYNIKGGSILFLFHKLPRLHSENMRLAHQTI